MLKIKHERTADCVVAGFRWHKNGPGTHVGIAAARPVRRRRARSTTSAITSSFTWERRAALVEELAPLREGALDGHPWARVGRVGERGRRRRLRPAAAGRRRPAGTAARTCRWEPLRSRAGRRGRLRPPPGRPLPPRDDVPALAPGQGAGRLPLRPAGDHRRRSSWRGSSGTADRRARTPSSGVLTVCRPAWSAGSRSPASSSPCWPPPSRRSCRGSTAWRPGAGRSSWCPSGCSWWAAILAGARPRSGRSRRTAGVREVASGALASLCLTPIVGGRPSGSATARPAGGRSSSRSRPTAELRAAHRGLFEIVAITGFLIGGSVGFGFGSALVAGLVAGRDLDHRHPRRDRLRDLRRRRHRARPLGGEGRGPGRAAAAERGRRAGDRRRAPGPRSTSSRSTAANALSVGRDTVTPPSPSPAACWTSWMLSSTS